VTNEAQHGPQDRPERVVVLVHGHPDYSAGGGEMAAYSLYRALKTRAPDDTWLVSAITQERARGEQGARLIQVADTPHEWAFIADGSDWPDFRSSSAEAIAAELIPFLQRIDPDVVHLHHYIYFGVDVIRLIRRGLPRARLIMTLHEYLAICTRDGQMVTRPGETLCSKASQIRCTGCFPELARSDIWRRETWFKRHFDLVDHFTTPSEFARGRYVGWGVDPDRISVVPNAQIVSNRPAVEAVGGQRHKLVFAYFGQINAYKGVPTLLGAVSRMLTFADRPFEVQVHGVIQQYQPGFKEEMEARMAELAPHVVYRGPYDASRVVELMQGADFVLVPSIWWENSPVVIEEAFHARRPVICADIGGMAEKVEDGVNGLHFRARDPESLAHVMWRCVEEPSLARMLGAGARRLPTLEDSDREYRAVYAAVPARS
jgi:glycosyltransferase involved in cell wall biosynthesis